MTYFLMKIFGLLAVLVTGGLLLSAVVDFPDFGDAHSPANAGVVSTHFIEKTYEETHVPNMVTAVLADYRGYDTMFETVVIFTGGIAIIAILLGIGGAPGDGSALISPHCPNRCVLAR